MRLAAGAQAAPARPAQPDAQAQARRSEADLRPGAASGPAGPLRPGIPAADDRPLIRLLHAGAAAFHAQHIAQEVMPEEAERAPLRLRAGLAAYAAAAGQGVAVIGSAAAAGRQI